MTASAHPTEAKKVQPESQNAQLAAGVWTLRHHRGSLYLGGHPYGAEGAPSRSRWNSLHFW